MKDSLAKRIDIDRFSKLERLVNTTARILKLYVRFKKMTRNSKETSVSLIKITRWTSGFMNRKRNCMRMSKVGEVQKRI